MPSSRSPRPLLAAISLLLVAPLLAAEPDTTLDKLNAEITRNLSAIDKNDRNSAFETERVVTTLSRVQKALERNNAEEAQQALTQLAVMKLSPAAKELINRLQTELPQIIEAKQKQLTAAVSAVIEKAGAACLKAEKESDLNEIAAEVASLRKSITSNYSSDIQTRAASRLDAASRFITRWQDFLAQKSNGYDDAARGILRELADSPQGTPIVPREKLLAKLSALEGGGASMQVILANVKTLEDLPKAVAELQKLRQADRRGTVDSFAPINDVTRMNAAWAAAKVGQYSAAMNFSASSDSTASAWTPDLVRIEGMLFSAVLPKYLALTDNPQPKAGENSSDFLLRLADEASAKGDWDRLRRVLEAYRIKAFSTSRSPSWLDADIAGCTALLAAQNFERALRLGPAILAYQRVLRNPGKFSPVTTAAQRLVSLQKDQPAEFKEAAQQTQLQEAFEAMLGQRF